jgi:GT2 family glycosyltransferase
VHAFATASPVPVTYLFEGRQGKSNALNTGLVAARGGLIVFTDDDVEVAPGWLEAAADALDADPSIDYTGGPVTPRWEREPPAWLDRQRGDLWGTLAILDYGADPFVFEDRSRVPLGVNMAVRRSLVERIGGFHPELGRRGRLLLGQEQAEFLARARAAGARGGYVPAMRVLHFVPASRMTKQYFRRWWYWKGVSRALVDGMHERTELGLDLRQVRRLGRVPQYVWGQAPREALNWIAARLRGDRTAAMRHAMHAAYAVGYVRGCRGFAPLAPVPPLPLPRAPFAPGVGVHHPA